MKVLFVLDYIAELIQFVFELGVYTRKYVVPAIVFAFVFVEYYIVPTIRQVGKTVQTVRLPRLVDLGEMGYYKRVMGG